MIFSNFVLINLFKGEFKPFLIGRQAEVRTYVRTYVRSKAYKRRRATQVRHSVSESKKTLQKKEERSTEERRKKF